MQLVYDSWISMKRQRHEIDSYQWSTTEEKRGGGEG